jgi:hypothetical protein
MAPNPVRAARPERWHSQRQLSGRTRSMAKRTTSAIQKPAHTIATSNRVAPKGTPYEWMSRSPDRKTAPVEATATHAAASSVGKTDEVSDFALFTSKQARNAKTSNRNAHAGALI